MDKKTAGLLGAVAGLATVSSAQAAITPTSSPSAALEVSTYADLLAPIPNAVAALKADDTARAQKLAAEVKTAQGYYYPYGSYYPQPSNPYYTTPYYYGQYNYRPYYYRYHHHHHHHHHHHNDWYWGR